jgi:hypothetical protein
MVAGHGDAGGVEILTGQAKFLRDLYRGVADEVRKGDTVEQAEAAVVMPAADANWNRPEMSQDISIVYAEIKAGRPAGSLPHVWQ